MSNFRENFSQNNFDLIRLFAATQVMVVQHAPHYLVPLDVGALVSWDISGRVFHPFNFLKDFLHGVPIFFVVSGFLISASFERSQNLRDYFCNRLLRIYPALWVCLALTVAVILSFGVAFSPGEFAKWLGAQFTFLQSYNPDFLRNFGTGNGFDGRGEMGGGVINGSLWTIPIELQFYCLFPILWIGIKKVFRRAPTATDAILVFLFFFGLKLFLDHRFYPYITKITEISGDKVELYIEAGTFLPNFYMFALGWALQRNMDKLSRLFVGKGLYWLAGYLVFVVAIYLGTIYFGFEAPSLAKSPAVRVVLGCVVVSLAYSWRGLAERITRRNDISYGVYIYHMLLVSVFSELGWRGSGIWVFVLVACTYVIAFLSWRFVEKPCLRLKKKALRVAAEKTI